ncbi:MAG TPA: NAD(P)-dependent oxidoreductase [Syntrophorhabdales bacterium]|nr:NAD(P)-dependent oxidoreductase [Syntrophorhabdales bacterium]
MKILVTGGAGYKGTVLVEELLNRGHKVTILDNFMYGYDSVLHLVNEPRLKIEREDIRNIREETVKGYDVIFHLAGISGYPACEANPHSAKLINVDASRRLGKLLSKNQVLIYASTTSFYGKSGAVCSEDSGVDPVSLYGITKYQAEQILLKRENTVALRFATIFGVSPRMRVDLLVNDFAYKGVRERCLVLFESTTKRTFLHIRDAIAGYLFTLDHIPQMKGQVFNVGHTSLNHSKMEIAEQVQKATRCKIIDSDMKDFDVRNFVISFDKLRKLGYEPKFSLEDGVKELVKLYNFYQPFSLYKTI